MVGMSTTDSLLAAILLVLVLQNYRSWAGVLRRRKRDLRRIRKGWARHGTRR
jgi:hypothetical protein